MEVQSRSPKDFDDDELELSIKETSAYFSKMLNLISSNVYMPADTDHCEPSSKYMKNQPKQKARGSTQKAREWKGKSIERKSIEELQMERELEEKKKQEEFLAGSRVAHLKGEDEEAVVSPMQVSSVKSTSLDDLKDRLQNKISQLQHKRTPTNPKSAKAPKSPKEKSKSKHNKKAGDKPSRKRPAEKPSITDEQGRVVYNKFDFLDPNDPPAPKRKKVDLQKRLAKAEFEKKRLEDMTDTDRAKKEESLLWSKAMNKVKGEKQRDDPALLKKSIKKKEGMKKKSQKEWNKRTKQVKKQMAKKQESRSQHIQERIDRKKEKKRGKRHKPGF